MQISKSWIKLYRKLGWLKIEPFNESQLNPNSYDLRLGNWFIPMWYYRKEPMFGHPRYYKDGDLVEITNSGTLLGMTKEKFGGVFGINAELVGRSSSGRLGIHVTPGWGDIGYFNYWTLQLSGIASRGECDDESPAFRAGDRIAQAHFTLTTPEIVKYAGQYQQMDYPSSMIPKQWRSEWVVQFQDVVRDIRKEHPESV